MTNKTITAARKILRRLECFPEHNGRVSLYRAFDYTTAFEIIRENPGCSQRTIRSQSGIRAARLIRILAHLTAEGQIVNDGGRQHSYTVARDTPYADGPPAWVRFSCALRHAGLIRVEASNGRSLVVHESEGPEMIAMQGLALLAELEPPWWRTSGARGWTVDAMEHAP